MPTPHRTGKPASMNLTLPGIEADFRPVFADIAGLVLIE